MTRKHSGTILYASLGKGAHVHEMVASVLSALSFRSVRSGRVRVTVYSDDVTPFAGLPIETVALSEDTVREWLGPDRFVYNVKIQALLATLRATDRPVALLDGDTYFRRDPLRLIRRIGPGRATLHVRECSMGQIKEDEQLETRNALDGHTYTSRRGDVLPLGQGMPCWNSGVVGVHPADVALIEEVVDLTAHLRAISGARLAEQLAFSLLLERYTKLRGCRDVVFHYWYKLARFPFSANLPRVLPTLAGLPPAERWAALYPNRPRYGRKYRFKRWVRTRVFAELGLRKRDYPMS